MKRRTFLKLLAALPAASQFEANAAYRALNTAEGLEILGDERELFNVSKLEGYKGTWHIARLTFVAEKPLTDVQINYGGGAVAFGLRLTTLTAGIAQEVSGDFREIADGEPLVLKANGPVVVKIDMIEATKPGPLSLDGLLESLCGNHQRSVILFHDGKDSDTLRFPQSVGFPTHVGGRLI